jgi:hypothetical protein
MKIKYVKPGYYDYRVNESHTHPVTTVGQIFEDKEGNRYIYCYVTRVQSGGTNYVLHRGSADGVTCRHIEAGDTYYNLKNVFDLLVKPHTYMCFQMIDPVYNLATGGEGVAGVQTISVPNGKEARPIDDGDIHLTSSDNSVLFGVNPDEEGANVVDIRVPASFKKVNNITPNSTGELTIAGSGAVSVSTDGDNRKVTISATVPTSFQQAVAISTKDPDTKVVVKPTNDAEGVPSFVIATNLNVGKMGNILSITAPQGGTGTVTSVNGVQPNDSGNVNVGSPQIGGVVWSTSWPVGSVQDKFLTKVFLGEDAYPIGTSIDISQGCMTLQSSGDTVSITKPEGKTNAINLEASIPEMDSNDIMQIPDSTSREPGSIADKMLSTITFQGAEAETPDYVGPSSGQMHIFSDSLKITKQNENTLKIEIPDISVDRMYNRSMCEIISEGTGYTGVKDLLTGHQAFDLPLKSKVPPEYPYPATSDVYMDVYYSSYIDQVMAVGPENERKQGPFYLWVQSDTVTRYSFMAIAVSEYNSYPVLQCLTYFRSGSGTVTNWKTYRVGPEGSGLPQKVTINITKEMKDMAMYPLSIIEGQFYMPGSTWQGYTDWKFQPYLITFGHIFYRYAYLN